MRQANKNEQEKNDELQRLGTRCWLESGPAKLHMR